jgi:hypothetical protein
MPTPIVYTRPLSSWFKMVRWLRDLRLLLADDAPKALPERPGLARAVWRDRDARRQRPKAVAGPARVEP